MRLAIGDFDSVHPEDMELIRRHAEEVIVLNPIKDDSDSESALRHALAMGYEKVWLACRMGGRMDHTWVNFRLAMMFPEKAVLYDSRNLITAYRQGRHVIPKNGYQFFSVFADEKACISLEGMKYPLREAVIGRNDIYTVSNEIEQEEGVLTVHEGTVLVMQCSDRRNKDE
jgi:thiamine pyrophosphokinase